MGCAGTGTQAYIMCTFPGVFMCVWGCGGVWWWCVCMCVWGGVCVCYVCGGGVCMCVWGGVCVVCVGCLGRSS